jgi:NADP-reducing hydrogenase subunit HndD
MVNLTINKQPISVPEGTTILEATRRIGMPVPTLCFLKDINEIAACRVCVVEVKGIERLVTACNNTVHEGMEVFTNTARVREDQRGADSFPAPHQLSHLYPQRQLHPAEDRQRFKPGDRPL